MLQSDKVEKLQAQSGQKKSDTDQPETGAVAASETVPESSVLQSPASESKATADSDEARTAKANDIVTNHVIASMATSLVPIPLVDLVALTGIQLKMLHSLAKQYRVPFSENMGKSLIVSLVGGMMPTSTAMTLASLAKSIPGLGTATGMVSVTILGGATTYAIGSVFMQHFESGGTLLDFDPKKMREYFTAKLQEGKKVAANLRRSSDQQT